MNDLLISDFDNIERLAVISKKLNIKTGKGVLFGIFLGLFSVPLFPQDTQLAMLEYELRIPEQTSQSVLWEDLIMHESNWYSTEKAIRIAENILIYQRGSGGWPKNIDFNQPVNEVQKKELSDYINEPLSTIDNGATYTQMRFLAKIFAQTGDQRYSLAFLKGLDYLLKAQYENGGWPQFYPLRKGYYSQITYNDDAMIGVLSLLRDVASGKTEYNFVDENRRIKARSAVEKGIDCILKTQIVVDGQLTAWCAQHDVKTFKPVKARAYELPSLSGKESVSIVWFLMEIENPPPKIIAAVEAAVKWLNKVKIKGIRQEKTVNPKSPTGFDKIVVEDSLAPDIWARFYQIGTNRPFFSDRDGKIYYDLSEISLERRNEYGWLGNWPQELLDSYYPQWQAEWVSEAKVIKQ